MAKGKIPNKRGLGRRAPTTKPRDLPLTRHAFEKVTGSSSHNREMVWRRGRNGPLKQILAKNSALSILTVHDHPGVRASIRRTLSALGVTELEDSEDGRAGLEQLDRRPPDLIIVGYEMAAMNGIEFLRHIRHHANAKLRALPVIVTIAEPTAQQIMEISNAGAHEILASPFSANALAQHMVAVFSENRRHIETAIYSGPERRNGGNGFTGKERRDPARRN